MTYRGTIRNGVVVLDNGADLPDGTVVSVEAETSASVEAGTAHARFMKLAGVIKDKPSDWARNHDHYIHGSPKR